MPQQHNPFVYHQIFGSVKWRLVPGGVEIENSGIERSNGRPTTVEGIWSKYSKEIEKAAYRYAVPIEYILATIATESSGNAGVLREEPGYISDEQTPHRISVGLMQTLISTASATIGTKVDRDWLMDPQNAIMAGTSYIRDQAPKTLLDGPLVFAAYNAGGIYIQNGPDNRWKTRQYPIGTSHHCDRAIKWLNDAVAVTMGGFVSKRGWEWFLRSLKGEVVL